MSDAELLHDYLATGSEPAFAELVERYISLVYSAARRQVRDTHMAEDVTQAVFIILARKAAAIRNSAMLGAWLVKTARQTSCNAIRFERCRRRHEQQAATMKSEHQTGVDPAAHIEGVLDELLSRLGERDRGALILRYLQDKSVNDVALALNVSPLAAQKRIGRALSRLKNLLARRGIITAGDMLEEGLGSQVLHAAPPGLALLASSRAMKKIAGGGAQTLAHATSRSAFWAKIQAIALGLASAAAIAMATTITVNSMSDTRASAADPVVHNPAALATLPTTAPAPITVPAAFPAVHVANDAFFGRGPADEYLIELDPKTLRTPASRASGHIKSLIPRIPKNGVYTDFATIMASRIYICPLDKVRGKRIRISAWIKTKDVRESAGLQVYAYGDGGEMLVHDNTMCVRPIRGTTDWQQYHVVRDIPQDATKIVMEAGLFCTGEMWIDDFQVEVVGSDVALTDDLNWEINSPVAGHYTFAVDPAMQHDGHATIRFESQTAPSSGWAIYQHVELHPNPKFLGHRIRITGWVKSSGVTGGSGFQIATNGPWGNILTTEGERGHRPIRGTRDWQQYSSVADVPPETKSIYWGLTMNGRGKLWLDQDSIQIELAEDAPKPAGENGL